MAAPSRLRLALRAFQAPFLTAGRAYNATAERHPLVTGLVTTLLKTSAADAFAQKVVEGRRELDLRRHGMFCAFGFFYLGGFQYWLYNHAFVRLCAPLTAAVGHTLSAPVKVFIDQAIHHPLLYFPTFYALKGSLEGRPFAASMAKYRAEAWDNWKACWAVWVPAQLVNFAFVPKHMRIPFVAGISFAWTIIMSAMRGAFDPSAAAATTTAAVASGAAAVATGAAAVIAVQGDARALAAKAAAAPAGLKALIRKE